MKLRHKAQLSVIITLAMLMVVLYVLLRIILLYSFAQVEHQAARHTVERLVNQLNDDLARLSSQVGDYAFWDDTYQFAQRYDETYVAELTGETLANLNLNLTLWVDAQGKMIFYKLIDLASLEDRPFPSQLSELLAADSPLGLQGMTTEGQAGIFMVGSQPMMLAAKPILTSTMEGPAQGMVIFGRWLDDAYIHQLSTTLRQAFVVYPLNDVLLAEYRPVMEQFNPGTSIVIQAADDHWIQSYTQMRDLYGQPALLLRVTMPRDIYAQGLNALNYFLAALLLVGATLIVITTLLLERLVLAPLAYLTGRITTIRQQQDLSQHIEMAGQDELAVLARTMNEMLDSLAAAHRDLKDANQRLEQRVEQRTVQLSTVNDRLRQEITAREQAQAALALARDQAMQSLRLKTQILANLSHDARTPLNIIMLRTQLLQSARYGAITDKQRETLDSILINARQLLLFFNNLLQEAQIKAEKVQLKRVEFQPAAVLRDVTATLLPMAANKGLTLSSEIAPELPATLIGDPEKITQILNNLIENAIKFTDCGGVETRLSRTDDDHWMLRVRDSGIGITPEMQTRIFDTFWQVDAAAVRHISQGVGLGLAIVRQLVTLMGGQVIVSSQPGAGSVFTVTLPLHTVKNKEQARESTSVDY